jgi:hypothetical protein
MRLLVSFLLIGLALPASAAEMWRWKDANGVTHYSDRPVAGAERLVISTSKSTAQPAGNPVVTPGPPPPPPEPVRYARCLVTNPASDQTFNSVNAVDATVQVEPALQEGHRIQIFLNGRLYTDWPESFLSYSLTELYRGSYVLSMRVVDADTRPLCASPSITFHIRQPSVLSPARRPAGR